VLTGDEGGEGDGEHEEQNGEPDGGLLQDVGGLRTPHLTGHAFTESCAKAFLLGTLHHDDEDEQEADDDFENREDGDEHKRVGYYEGKPELGKRYMRLIGSTSQVMMTSGGMEKPLSTCLRWRMSGRMAAVRIRRW